MQPITIKRPHRPVEVSKKDDIDSKEKSILTVDDAIIHYAEKIEIALPLLDVLINQRYAVDTLKSLGTREKLDLLSHLIRVKNVSKLNDRFTKYPQNITLKN